MASQCFKWSVSEIEARGVTWVSIWDELNPLAPPQAALLRQLALCGVLQARVLLIVVAPARHAYPEAVRPLPVLPDEAEALGLGIEGDHGDKLSRGEGATGRGRMSM